MGFLVSGTEEELHSNAMNLNIVQGKFKWRQVYKLEQNYTSMDSEYLLVLG